MKVRVRNVGLLKDVSVELKGLTVIAGENDTGKSTLGKAIFVLQKSHMMSKGGFFYKNWKKYINYRIRDFKLLISSILETRALYDEIANILNSFQLNAESVLDSKLKEHEKGELLKKHINELRIRLRKYPNIPVDEFISKLLQSTYVEFKNTFKKRNLQSLLEYQFHHEPLSKYLPDEESLIEIKSLTGSISATIQGLNVKSFKEEGSSIVRDVTFIDTPVIFQLINLLSEEEVITKKYTPTIKDLRRKIKDQKAKLLPWEEEEAEELIESIQKIINADIHQQWDGNFYMFRKSFGKSIEIRLENAATGIKSFSLLSILIQKGWIRNNTLLIVDEPEVHLHPIWQIKYAQILIELVRRGVYVLVSTHSPYMVQALEKFTKTENLRDKTNFYLFSRMEKEPFIYSEEVSSEINKIYRLFVSPVREILGW